MAQEEMLNFCSDTDEEKLELIAKMIETYKDKEGCLIMVLHAAQEIYGYLPVHVQAFVAEKLNIPQSQVSGVVTFYSFFTTTEKGKHTVRVCLGTACYVRGGRQIVDALEDKLGISVGGITDDKLFSFEIVRCIGACGLAPAIMIDDDVYKQVTPRKIDTILARYKD